MKKIFVLSLFVALGLMACGDENSSGTAPSADPIESSAEQAVDSNGSAQKNNVSSSSVKETSGETPATVESSSAVQNSVPESNGSLEPASSAQSSENKSEDAECVESVNAQITLTSVENINMSCSAAAKGMTVYNTDTQILSTCDGVRWNEKVVVLCKHEEEPVQEVSVTYGTLTDARDGQTYKTIEIGEQTWMAENLNYESNTSYCYQNSLDSCDKYGRLYTYNEADTVCPEGYRLPTKMDFDNLLRPLSETVYDERLDWHYNLIELSIKATTDWVPDTTTYVNENGELTHLPDATNSSGYTLLPAGYMKPNGGFYGAGKDTYLWSSADGSDAGTKYAMELEYRYDGVTFYWWELDYAFSVRCVKK